MVLIDRSNVRLDARLFAIPDETNQYHQWWQRETKNLWQIRQVNNQRSLKAHQSM